MSLSPVSSPARTRAAWAGLLTLALALRVFPWTKPNGFTGVREYDDGVYYASAKLLLHGLLPYRDVTVVHPPGLSLLLLPFAVLGDLAGDDVGMAAARVAVVLVALANVVLVVRLARGVDGVSERVALVAGLVYALSPNALAAEHTVLLEPVVTLLCLLALRRVLAPDASRTVVCGALLGVAVSVKLFGGAYLVAVVVWLLARGRRRDAAVVLAGFGAALAVLVGPFAVLAPTALWHDVVMTQLSRPVAATANGWDRLADMAGLGSAPLLLALVVLGVLAALAVASRRAQPTALWLLVAVVVAGAFLEAATYFPHYGSFLAPALGVLAAVVVARPRPRLGAVAVLGLVVVMACGAWSFERKATGQADLSAVGRLTAGHCLFYEQVSAAVAADVLAVPSDDCPAWVDARGTVYATSGREWAHRKDFYYRGFTGNAAWQDAMVDQMGHADFLLLTHDPAHVKEWSEATRAFALEHFRLERVFDDHGGRPYQLWQRTP